jgi:hypothetical protein
MTSKEDLVSLEKRIYELNELNNKYVKEKKNLEMTTEYLSVNIII